jgi:general secretion pathway protein J
VAHLEFAYWGSPSEDQPAGWQAQWDNFNIPKLIRVRLAFAKGDRRHWPDLIAAPQR